MKSDSVSIIIPTYNGRKLLQQHLPAVETCLTGSDELIIIDDASSDDSIEWLCQRYDAELDGHFHWAKVWRGRYLIPKSKDHISVIVAQNQKNLRFGETANTGVAMATKKNIWLLNSDVSPEPDCLTHLRSYDMDDVIFGVGCLEKEPVKTHDNKTDFVLGGKNYIWFSKGLFWHSRASEFHTGETAWVSGGSGFFSREKWLQLGGFDRIFYPAYWEDVDLSARAREKGWKIWFEEKAVVFHNHESTNSNVFAQQTLQDMSWKNSLKFAERHVRGWQVIQFYLWRPWWWIREQFLRFKRKSLVDPSLTSL